MAKEERKRSGWGLFLLFWTMLLLTLGFLACIFFYKYAAAYEDTLPEKTMDALRARYGHTALSRASVLCDPTLTNIDAKNDHTIHPVGYIKAGQSVGG